MFRIMGLNITPVAQCQTITSTDNNLSQQLEDLLAQYRAHMGDEDQTVLKSIMQKLKTFLQSNGALIMEQCYMNGYSNSSPDWAEHYGSFYNGALQAIESDLSSSQPFNPDFINEQATQLHFLLSTHNK